MRSGPRLGNYISPYGRSGKMLILRKSQDDVEKMVAGPDGVYICNECVALCNDIMAPGPAPAEPAAG